MNTVHKIYTGEVYEEVNGKKYTLMGTTSWAIVNDKGQVVEFYSTKTIAQYEANILNSVNNG